jgi:hypothetical protein
VKKYKAVLALLVTILLGACGGGGDGSGGGSGGGGGGSGSFSGTVTAPQNATVRGTEVVACFYIPSTDDCDERKSKSTTINATGRSGNFSIRGLEPGDYYILAVNEAQGLIGAFVDNRGIPVLVRPPRSDINIELVPRR